jgi:hypothetical protein
VDHSSCNPSTVTASEEILANNCRPYLHFKVSGPPDHNIVYCILKPGWKEVEVMDRTEEEIGQLSRLKLIFRYRCV